MKKNFEYELPPRYTEAYMMDAKEKKTGLIMNGVALLIEIIILAIGIPLLFLKDNLSFELTLPELLIALILLFLSMAVYIVLHELTHGVAYKLLTREKLTYGISWSCAFCGVPSIYVYRRSAIIALIAPLVLFTFVLLPICVSLYFVHPLYYILSLVVLGMHVGGCSGDGFLTILFLFKFKSKDTLVRDTGPTQHIYVLNEEVTE